MGPLPADRGERTADFMKPAPDPCRAPSATPAVDSPTPAVDSPTPAVSVVMPVRDAEAYLSRAVASILEQTLGVQIT